MQFCSKNNTQFKKLNSLNIENNVLPQHSQNYFDFTNFPANMFLFGFKKNICIAPFLEAQELHSWKTLKANVCIFLNISVEKFLFQRYSKSLIGRGWIRKRLNNSFKAAWCLGLVKYFTIFYFNWNFWKFNYFGNPSIALKRLNFSCKLEFKGKIVATFLIRSHFLSR